ncbi:MAG: hypothetical protein IT489_00180 [Gammaproteobacteria bacterium]|nr:hypothetical protein [Gammaproteobacteria bacterium]
MPLPTFLLLLLLLSLPAAAADPVWVEGWRATSPLTTARAGAAVLEAGGHIYALGGVDGRDFLKTVEYAPIRADGSLGEWHLTAPLKEARGFFDAVAHGGYLYAAGGGNGPNGEHLLASVERAPIRADGRLGPWETLPVALNLPRRCVKLAVVGDTLYALGGFGGTLLDTVERATFTAGGLAPFAVEPARMTLPRYVNAAKAHDGRLYVLGGHNENEGTGLAAVEYAVIDGGGDIAAWKRTSDMGTGRYALSDLVHGDHLYALGGLDGARYTDSIELSRIQPDGSLSSWRTTTPLSSPRANFGALEHGGRVYIVGGTNRDGYYRSVEVAAFDAAGDIGYRATPEEAAAAATQHAAAHAERARASKLPNAGEVREILHTEAYSYIRVAGEHGEQWIASSRLDCPVTRRIRYSRGTEMTGFHSRALGRDFDSILFVEGAECVE